MPAGHEVLGMILWQVGDRDRAAAELRRFAESSPLNRDLLRHDPGHAALRDDPRVKSFLAR